MFFLHSVPLQVLCVVGAFVCSAYLVAFTGVPLVLSVVSSPEREKEAVESAFRDAAVYDETELRSSKDTYVSWAEKEAIARGLTTQTTARSTVKRR